ncbi:MAG: exopolysaccharide biosynthesis polyprenyl glycosylphosphotransferase [Oscillospiraceae bacterium]|nr:exopolysaccharide biosynthesis polyprenyl glycosylphosphotransferase [Oscillospiraceae bacterium]
MRQKAGSFILFLSKATLVFAILAIFFFGQRFYYEDTLYYFWGNNIVLLLYTAMLYLTSRIYNGFTHGNASIQDIIVSWVLCLIIVNAFIYLTLSLLVTFMLPVGGFIVIFLVQVAFVIPMSIIINVFYYMQNPALSTILIYGDIEKLQIYRRMITKQRRKFKVAGVVSQHENIGPLLDAINNVKAVFFLDVEEVKQEGLLEYCYLNDKHTYVLPSFSKILLNAAGTIWLSDTPAFSLKKPPPDFATQMVKRLIDIILSLTSIIITSPIMIIIYLSVRLYDRHPAIYKQTRMTKNGRLFTLYKFRSMRPDAEDDGVPRLTSKDDDRITPVGHVIRRTRLDELPQLFNVLSGAMSLVGPRPERPEIAEQYEQACPNFAFRTKVKAGITGFAQIYGRYNTSPEEKLFLDIMYIEKFSILQDLKLMLQTVKVLFQGSSTEGIKDGVTALDEERKDKNHR